MGTFSCQLLVQADVGVDHAVESAELPGAAARRLAHVLSRPGVFYQTGEGARKRGGYDNWKKTSNATAASRIGR